MKNELLRLAEECEMATGPLERLDWQIRREVRGAFDPDAALPYTRSLDAALTLIPAPYAWSIQRDITFTCEAIIYGHEMHQSADAATPALAMCAAVLRVLAAPHHKEMPNESS